MPRNRAGKGLAMLVALGLAGLAAGAQAQGLPPAKAMPAPMPAPSAAAGPVGVWIDHTGRGAVEISACGAALCGRLVWMKDPSDKNGKPFIDDLNSDKSKRGRPVCGIQIIGAVQKMDDGSWDKGWIYDPEQGESFDVELRMLKPDVLQVKGYKGLKFLSETFQWRRAAQAPQPACPASNP